MEVKSKICRWMAALTVAMFTPLPGAAWASYVPITVEEADGAPSVKGTKKIVVTNGSLAGAGTTATITIGGGVTVGGAVASGAANRVLYEDSGNLLAEDVNLQFDGTTLLADTVDIGGGAIDGTKIGFTSAADATFASINFTSLTTVTDAAITAGGGITASRPRMRIAGSGGAVDLTANPQIVDGVNGQIVTLQATHATNTVKLDDGTGLGLAGAVSFTMAQGDTITLIYDSTDDLWYEISRADN